jgi:hypothetical protein
MIWGFSKAASNLSLCLSLSLSVILCKERLGILWQIWDFLGAPNLGSNLLVLSKSRKDWNWSDECIYILSPENNFCSRIFEKPPWSKTVSKLVHLL